MLYRCQPIPPAFCGGLIEAEVHAFNADGLEAIPPAFCGGLIEATAK